MPHIYTNTKPMKATDILAAMRHQLAPTVSTWSACANQAFCNENARGGRECIKCLRSQLIEECGSVDKVDAFITYQRATFTLANQIIALAGGEVEL